MNILSISQLARAFGLSRSTLLYYDRIGLLRPARRTRAGYRSYSPQDRERLERICTLRRTGLSLADVQQLLSGKSKPSAQILENRLQEMDAQIVSIRAQQQQTIALLKKLKRGARSPLVDKGTWVRMLEAAGMDDDAKAKWHAEFETRAPNAHHAFLLSLGIPESEALQIRRWSGLRPIR